MKGQSLEFRLVAVKDPRFQKLVQEFEREYRSRSKTVTAQHRAWFSTSNLEQACVLFCAGQPVACGGFAPVDEETAELKLIYVRPEQRRKGYARQMIEALELQVLFQGYMHMVLAVARNTPETALFRRVLGYRETTPWGTFAEAKAWVCMKKELME